MTVTYSSKSLYSSTPQVFNYVSYLDVWNGIVIASNASDILINLDAKYKYRPDLLSNDQYGTPQLWWVFMLRNPDIIKDPVWDFITGINIYVPLKTSLTGYI